MPEITTTEPRLPRGPKVINIQIPRTSLPLYQQAGEETNFQVEVIAKEGEVYQAYVSYDEVSRRYDVFKPVQVEKGKLGIGIHQPTKGELDHTRFWRVLERLQSQLPQ